MMSSRKTLPHAARHGAVIGLAGFSGSGKTTLAERLIAAFCGRGIAVASIKHAHESFAVDTPGKDSYRHRQAGAAEVIIASDSLRVKFTAANTAAQDKAALLDALLADLAPAELVLVEGFKHVDFPKIEIRRGKNNESDSGGCRARNAPASRNNKFPGVFLIATDTPPQKQPKNKNESAGAIPFCHIDDIETIADSIATRMQKGDTP